MAKKKVHSKAKAPKYRPFKLYGSYSKQQVLTYIVIDSLISFGLGFFLQGQIMQALAAH